jgi:alkanesulfonate monooxygenase SsuD/methylene tetrahydromethanopterin reductase-like flavin-dependent oxidoreductase (luciferase family)
MYALLIEVNADGSQIDATREFLPKAAVPRVREAGAKAGYWLAPQNGRGVSVLVFDTEEEARALAARFEPGKPPMPDAPGGVTVKMVEVREVIASV